MNSSRREFLRQSSFSGVGLLTFSIAGCDQAVTPREAREQEASLQVFSVEEKHIFEVICEQIVPGSAEAGVAHYVDHQLASSPADNLLMIRYLGVPAPYVSFYQGGLAAANEFANKTFDLPVVELDTRQARVLVDSMAGPEIAGWDGPPPGFFFFVIRGDAVDVRYGTQDGFASLDIPFQPHIVPPSPWGDG